MVGMPILSMSENLRNLARGETGVEETSRLTGVRPEMLEIFLRSPLVRALGSGEGETPGGDG